MKRIIAASAVLSLVLSGCSAGRSDAGTSSLPQTQAPVTAAAPPVTTAEPEIYVAENDPNNISFKAKVMSFDSSTLVVDRDGEELSFNIEANDLLFEDGAFDEVALSDPLGKGHILKMLTDKDCKRIISISFPPEGCEMLEDYYTVEDFGIGTVTLKNQKETLKCTFAPRLMDDNIFAGEYIGNIYSPVGIRYPDGDVLLLMLMPLLEDMGEGKLHFGSTENRIDSYGAAEITGVYDDYITVKRTLDGRELEILPLISDKGVSLEEGARIYFAPMTGKPYDSDDIDRSDCCNILPRGDIDGSIGYVSDYQRLSITSGRVKIYPEHIYDQSGAELSANEAKALKDTRYSVSADDIIAVSTANPEYTGTLSGNMDAEFIVKKIQVIEGNN